MPCIKLDCTVYKQFSDSANIYGSAETNNEVLGEIGTDVWTSLVDGEVLEASISMTIKRMDESDVSAFVASQQTIFHTSVSH